VIGTTDDRDGVPADPRFKITLAGLDLEGPPASASADWEHAPHLIRVVSASSGRIEKNSLRGGSVVFAGGPWAILENVYKGRRRIPSATACSRVDTPTTSSWPATRPARGAVGQDLAVPGPLPSRVSDVVKDNVVEAGSARARTTRSRIPTPRS